MPNDNLIQDGGFRWRDDLTEHMQPAAVYTFLLYEAKAMEDQGEWDCMYSIFRELIWRFPDDRSVWIGLGRAAEQLGYQQEAQMALERAKELVE